MRQDELLCGVFSSGSFGMYHVPILFSSQATYEASLPGPAARDHLDFRNGYALYHYTPQKDEGNGCQDKVSIMCFEHLSVENTLRRVQVTSTRPE
jgi:hypothetical protein